MGRIPVLLVTMVALGVGLVMASSAAAGGEGCGYQCPPPPPSPKCKTQSGTVYLDRAPANVNNRDGKVTFCHATSSATNPYVVITTSVNACRAHETHSHQPKGGSRDVFPTGGCRD